MALLEFNEVSYIYPNGLKAISNLSLKIDRGEFVFLIGHTGAGKTTLLKLIHREIVPTEGTIFFDNVDISTIPWSQVPYYRRKIGVVFQDLKLLNYKTAFENVAYALEITCLPPKKVIWRVPRLLKNVGLWEKRNFFPDELSGGEQQRLAIARAIANDPLVLLADEPTGNLDWDTAEKIMEIFLEINRRGTTVIMSTHNLELVRKYKKRTIKLSRGYLIDDYIP